MKVFAIILIFLATSVAYSIDWYHFEEQSDTKGGTSEPTGAYNIVICDITETGCELICIGGGAESCDWDACDCNCDFFTTSSSQGMFDYAHQQMNANTLTGNYTNNIILPTGVKYYRTISWVQDSNGIRTLDYTLGVD